MEKKKQYDVIIVGGSYSGLAAAMALGRALRQVLVIDSGLPCNRQTPYSHNFIGHDGQAPAEVARVAREQVMAYSTITFMQGTVKSGEKSGRGFSVTTVAGESFYSKKLIFATGVKDIMAPITGFAECWGISVLHCPYCHGYEVRNQRTGILANNSRAFELATLLSNWTGDLTIFTNGKSTIAPEHMAKLREKGIKIDERLVRQLSHANGYLQHIHFGDGSSDPLKVLYAPTAFEQHCPVPVSLGCQLTEEGYIQAGDMQATTVPGVFACGDNTTRMRSLSIAISMGTRAGIAASRELIFEEF